MMDLYTAEAVLALLKETASKRTLNSDEQKLGRIAAKIFGQHVHEGAVESKKAYDRQVFEHLTKEQGYTAQEARTEIATEEFNGQIARGFGTSKRCRIGAPNCTPQRSHCAFKPLDYAPAYQLLGLA
jgi:hypothetical protein